MDGTSGPVRGRHAVTMLDRGHLDITGVERVESFDHQEIVLVTALGVLRITGENLHIQGLDLETGMCGVNGSVESLTYKDGKAAQRRGNMLQRLVR